jgi:hypothetical protein
MQRLARGRSPRHPMDGDWLPLSWSGADRVAGAVMDHVLWFNAA